MQVIGVTGGIASGKTTVCRFLRELGYPVIDADALAHQVLEPGNPVYEQVVGAFGDDMLAPDGSIDRKRLAARIFASPGDRRQLEELTHGAILRRIQEEIEQARRGGHQAVFVEVPLLYETGNTGLFDRIWVVWAERSQQIERLLGRTGMSRREALERMAAQIPLKEKLRRADEVIDNSGSERDARLRVIQLCRRLKGDLPQRRNERGGCAGFEEED